MSTAAVQVWKVVARILAVAALAVAILDGYQLLRASHNIFSAGADGSTRSVGLIEHAMAAGSAAFCIALLLAAAVAWARPVLGLTWLTRIFVAQILYELLLVLLSWPVLVPAKVAISFAAAFGAGNVGMYIQILSGLPIWALVLALLAARTLRKPQRATMRTKTPKRPHTGVVGNTCR